MPGEMRQAFDKNTLADEELHDLKLRFELLEGDRKAYYETSQWAIRQNKDEISRLRSQNKEISEAIANRKKGEADVPSNRYSMTELEKFDQKVLELHKKYDELLADVRAKENRIQEMRDQLEDLRREEEMVRSHQQDSPQAREIRSLENRLDKATIKYHEAQAVRKVYEQIVKRLQEERLTFDNQLANFEKALKVKKQDAMELESMSRDANHAKEVAKTELAMIEQQINEERKQREKDLYARRELVKHKMEIADKIDWKKLQLEDQAGELAMTTEANKDQFDEARERKFLEFEENMRLIKEATGVSDINEVISKFQSQGDTHEHLTQLQKANEVRYEELKKKKANIVAEFDDLKYSGETKHAHSRRMAEEMQQHLAEAENRTAEAKAKFERVAKLMTNVKAGVQHLSDKVDVVQLPDTAPPATADEDIPHMLERCLKKLEQLSNSLQGKELPEVVSAPPATSQQPSGEATSIFHISPSQLPAYNTRVKLRPVDFEELSLDGRNQGPFRVFIHLMLTGMNLRR
ncbi:hypothetical protein BC832DRAFT_546480 [Gaertneriomyces semiglobifer]|nr:hypothetical protein BC832DRAFT_546480 [Gaertneriomyces semiglobifer]